MGKDVGMMGLQLLEGEVEVIGVQPHTTNSPASFPSPASETSAKLGEREELRKGWRVRDG
jgi:hypothetical protein